MATPQKKPATLAKPAPATERVPDGTDKGYFIVNPKGCIHVVTKEHARERLKLPGWRLATPQEIAAYHKADGLQRAGRPLAAPWVPDVDDEPELGEPKPEPAAE